MIKRMKMTRNGIDQPIGWSIPFRVIFIRVIIGRFIIFLLTLIEHKTSEDVSGKSKEAEPTPAATVDAPKVVKNWKLSFLSEEEKEPLVNVKWYRTFLFLVASKSISVLDAQTLKEVQTIRTTPIRRDIMPFDDHLKEQRADIMDLIITHFHELNMYPNVPTLDQFRRKLPVKLLWNQINCN